MSLKELKAKISGINSRLKNLEEKAENLQEEINELESEHKHAVMSFAVGEVTEEDLTKIEKKIVEKKKELATVTDAIPRIKAIRKEIAKNEVIPFVKKRRRETEDIQAEYDKQVEVVRKARNAWLRELYKLGEKERNLEGKRNAEINGLLKSVGEEPLEYGASISPVSIYGSESGWNHPRHSVGVDFSEQLRIYNGYYPKWIRDDEEYKKDKKDNKSK
jgi:chromosome segregation ATPase